MKEIYDDYVFDADIVLSCDDALNFTKKLPDNSIGLIFTSPPYNIGKEYEEKLTINEYLRVQEALIAELVKKINIKGSLCWQVGNYVQNGEIFPLDIFYYNIFKKYNLKLRNRIIWHFGHGLHATKRFSGRYETILWFTKSDDYVFNLDDVRVPSKYPGKRYYKGDKKGQPSGNPLGKNPSDIWEIVLEDWDKLIWEIPNVKAKHPEKTIHPCQFPVELVERCVLALTNENDTVFDPYAGVASTLVAAIKHKRKAIGVDKEKDYILLGKERIQKLLNNALTMRELGTPIYQPTEKDKVSKVPEEWIKN